ncbi:hypothetical protein IWQ60_007793 [Tieghemiomyces parasiticus]|uniref:Uncharacterized protein n=1 Tax=Tieghemiomyces parasiticus TaxID=78921 RepID=A0A9W8DTP0_9FUNG|nr:hypothetical protein IWQ60_007793 [Tieghemiomyces parasiticus]
MGGDNRSMMMPGGSQANFHPGSHMGSQMPMGGPNQGPPLVPPPPPGAIMSHESMAPPMGSFAPTPINVPPPEIQASAIYQPPPPQGFDGEGAPGMYSRLNLPEHAPLEELLSHPGDVPQFPGDGNIDGRIMMPDAPGRVSEPMMIPPAGFSRPGATSPLPTLMNRFRRFMAPMPMGVPPGSYPPSGYHKIDNDAFHTPGLLHRLLNGQCWIITTIIAIILLVVVALLLYLALTKNGQPCGAACLGVGDGGLYLDGSGQASILSRNNNTCRAHDKSDVYYAAIVSGYTPTSVIANTNICL